MLPDYKSETMYFETEDDISIIEDVMNVDFFLEERERLALSMGYSTNLKSNKTLDIFDEDGKFYGTYFAKSQMN